MNNTHTLVLGLVLLGSSMDHPVRAQADRLLMERIDSQFLILRESSFQAFQGLLSYPKELRDACLEVSQHPELIARLNLVRESGHGVDSILEPYPTKVRSAARVLTHPACFSA